MNDNKLSVIVPIYNAEKYLDRCIKSLLGQTFRNLEIILINDGSTDSSLLICKKYKDFDSRIVLINKDNKGVSAARKDGINASTGDFIAFVDADDYLAINMYKELMSTIVIEDCDIIESGYILVNEKNDIIYTRSLKASRLVGREQCLEKYLSNDSTETFLWNKIYRSDLFKDINLPEYRYSEDYLWNVLLYARCNKSITVSQSYYYYYKNMQGACNNGNYLAKLDGVYAGVAALQFLKEYCPSLKLYGNTYIFDYCRFLYMIIFQEKIAESDVISELITNYRRYFSFRAARKYKSLKKVPGYLLFYIFPGFYAKLNKLYHRKNII